MAVSEEGLSGKALEAAKAYNRALAKSEESLQKQKKYFDEISTTLLGIDGGKFFRDLTNDEFAKATEHLTSQLDDLKKKSLESGAEMNQQFQDLIKKSGVAIENSEQFADKLGLGTLEAKALSKHWNKGEADFMALSQTLGEFGDGFMEKIKTANLDKKLTQELAKSVEEGKELSAEIAIVSDEIDKFQKKTFSLSAGLSAIGQNITKGFSFGNLITEAKNYDATIKKAQIETGIAFDQNAVGMSQLTGEAARFGMGVQEATAFMGELGKELRTTNFGALKEAAVDLAAMGKATGLSTGETAKLAKEYLKFGSNTQAMTENASATMKNAAAYGLSGKEVMQEMAKNMSKMRQMGFTGGEASLRRMVLESKRLGMNVDEIFETGKKARNIEGAMQMAADLQLAGGSFAAIDPMQLLSAARKGPEELQKILGQMGKDIGAFNEDGEYKFDPIDVDRLQMVADATGQSMDSLQNMIAQNAEDNRKLEMLPPSLLGENLTDEEKAFLMQATSIKDGKLTVNAGVEGLDDLQNMNQQQINALMKQKAEEKADLEEQANQNMGLQESITNLKTSFTNVLLPFLQKVIQHATDAVQWLNSFGTTTKTFIGGFLAAMMLLFGPAKAFANGIMMARGFNAAMSGKGFLGSVKSMFSKIKPGGNSIQGPKPPESPQGDSAKGGWIESMAEGLKKFKDVKYGDILKLGFALITIGAAVALFMAGISAVGTPDGSQLIAAAGAMAIMAGGLWLTTKILGKMNMGDVIKGALAMGIMGLALVPFAYAAQMMSDVDWLNVLAGVGVAALVVAGLAALGVAMAFAWPFLLLGAGGLAIAGAALLVGAYMMSQAGNYLVQALAPLEQIKDADWSGLAPFAEAIGAFGIDTAIAGVGLLIGAAMLAQAAPMLAQAAPLLISMATTEWSGLIGLAGALNALGPALLGFAAAGLLMFNPLSILGITVMLSAISALKDDMSSLAPNLQMGADGLERMSAGVAQLEAAVAAMNMEKLQQLSEVMAEGGAEMGKFVAEINKAEDRKVTHVVQLQIDGKDLQEIILKDTKHLK